MVKEKWKKEKKEELGISVTLQRGININSAIYMRKNKTRLT